MPVVSGTRFGPYEILSPIGAGGMGEVFKARDTRLDRTVAIKVLSAGLGSDAQFKQRFEREARAISNLNHPNICTLYDVGSEGSVEYLVMEYLEGQTLSDRIAGGPMKVQEVVRHGIDIANALDRAHRAGIIHRDLKPGNIMLTASGAKLLDFGLAKYVDVVSDSNSNAPTIPAVGDPLTREGSVVGTLLYMAPEQLEGKALDARTDIFALGAILYEMVSGRRAFQRPSQAGVMAAVLQEEPPLLDKNVMPSRLGRIVSRCLAKNPEKRWNCCRDLLYELSLAEQPEAPTVTEGKMVSQERKRWILGTVALGAVLVMLGANAIFTRRKEVSTSKGPIRFTIAPAPGSVPIFDPSARGLALSPDGERLAYAASGEGRSAIWVRSLDSLEAKKLAGTDGAFSPFWSADGKWIGFFANRKLMKISADGGSPQMIRDNISGGAGSWSANGDILLVQFGTGTADEIERVTQDGRISSITSARGKWSLWPSFLPDGSHFLFVRMNREEPIPNPAIYAGKVGSPTEARLLVHAASNPHYSGGYLYYVKNSDLLRQTLDLETMKLGSEVETIAEHLRYFQPTCNAQFTVSAGGEAIAYQSGVPPGRLMWVDRQGKMGREAAPSADYRTFRISRDTRVVASVVHPSTGVPDVSMIDTARAVTTSLTHSVDGNYNPVMSPDGNTIIFSSSDSAAGPTLRIATNSQLSDAKPLSPSSTTVEAATDVSADSRHLLYTIYEGATADVYTHPLGPSAARRPVAATPFHEREATFTPDGLWVSYVSEESGKAEVYAAPFSGNGERVRISVSGGSEPRWNPNGREMFYISGDHRLVSVPVSISATQLKLGDPVPLFTVDCGRMKSAELFAQQCYDVAPSGNEFLLRVADEGKGQGEIVVLRH